MIWSMWLIFIMFSFIFFNVIIKIDDSYFSISYTFAFLFHIFQKHFTLFFFFAYISLSHSVICISNFSYKTSNFSFALHTINLLLSHTMTEVVPYGYVSILLNVCNTLSSSLVSVTLLTSFVYIS